MHNLKISLINSKLFLKLNYHFLLANKTFYIINSPFKYDIFLQITLYSYLIGFQSYGNSVRILPYQENLKLLYFQHCVLILRALNHLFFIMISNDLITNYQ